MPDTQSPDKIYILGQRGMVGSDIVCALHKQGETTILTRTHAELELISQAAVEDFLRKKGPGMFILLTVALQYLIRDPKCCH